MKRMRFSFSRKKKNQRDWRKKGRKKYFRKWLGYGTTFFVFGLGLIVFGLVAERGIHAFETSSLFSLRHFEVVGQKDLSEQEILKLLGIPKETTLGQLDLYAMKERLMTHPKIEAVSLHKGYPDQLRVEVRERTAVAALEGKNGLWGVVDRFGVVMEKVAVVPKNLPRFIHTQIQTLGVGDVLKTDTLNLGFELLEVIGREGYINNPMRIDLSQPGNMILELENFKVHFGGEDYEEKWRRFMDIKNDLEKRGIRRAEVNLRFPGKVVVSRTGKGLNRRGVK